MALAFETGRGDAMEGIDFEKNAAWCDADHSGEAFDRALEDGGEDATCALGVLRRDVARVAGDLEIWFGYSSNFRDVDANEKKAAKKAAKRFATLSAVGGDADDGDDDDARDARLRRRRRRSTATIVSALDVEVDDDGRGARAVERARRWVPMAQVRAKEHQGIVVSAVVLPVHGARVSGEEEDGITTRE
uniref:Uncharacterized protein n=1 Tax=Ostreococcus sp. 'lucimarinus' TaxID=242159 RepID=A0A7R9T3S9_9CHLO